MNDDLGDRLREAFPEDHGWGMCAWREGRGGCVRVHVFKAELWIGDDDAPFDAEPSVVSVRGYGATKAEAKRKCLEAWRSAKSEEGK